MLRRMFTRAEAEELLGTDVLDIHGVAELLGIKRSSVNTLRVRRSAGFPEPIYQTSGDHRHPVRLWWRADIADWASQRPSQQR